MVEVVGEETRREDSQGCIRGNNNLLPKFKRLELHRIQCRFLFYHPNLISFSPFAVISRVKDILGFNKNTTEITTKIRVIAIGIMFAWRVESRIIFG